MQVGNELLEREVAGGNKAPEGEIWLERLWIYPIKSCAAMQVGGGQT